jgi:hypothetical protein
VALQATLAAMRIAALAMAFLLASCGEAIDDNHFAEDVREARVAPPPVTTEAVPVRVGELGPSLPACGAMGLTRNIAAGDALQVRSAPFDTAAEVARIASGRSFFICSRSHDQKWFGVVFDEEEGASARCGVAPVSARRDYDGVCLSGWVPAPFVKFISGPARTS